MSNTNCTTGTKFVLKGGGGVRKQFVILNGKIIHAWFTNGLKITNCTNFTDITSSVECAEIPGASLVELGSKVLASTTTTTAGTTTTPTAEATTTTTTTTPTAEATNTSSAESMSTLTVPSTCPNQLNRTNLVFVEDGKTLTQENAFNEDSGVIEIVVPAHANYRKTQFVIHETGVLLKTNGACSISPTPENYNVSSHHNSFANKMAARLQKSDNKLEDEPKYHILKIRQERVGYKQRKELNSAHSSACDDEPIVKTEDESISEEQFKMLVAGNFITVDQEPTGEQRNRQVIPTVSTIVKLKSTGGPQACGRGFKNPYIKKGGFSFHQLSYGTLDVLCCATAPAPAKYCPLIKTKKLCDCSDIVDKNTFMNCRVQDPIKNEIQTGGNGGNPGNDGRRKQQTTLTTQTLTFKKKSKGQASSMKVEMPAHSTVNGRQLKDMTVIMNAGKNGAWHETTFYKEEIKNNMMTKIGDDCQVMTLPAKMFPADIAIGLQEIKESSVPEDDIDRHFLNRQLDDADVPGLHPLMIETCPNGVKSIQQKPISKEESDMLGNGGVIFLEDNLGLKRSLPLTRQGCDISTKKAAIENATGCWRWPNENGPALYVHGISTRIEEIQCCQDNGDGCCDSLISDGWFDCKCSEIKDKASFKKCAG